jgi:hypothetical protein
MMIDKSDKLKCDACGTSAFEIYDMTVVCKFCRHKFEHPWNVLKSNVIINSVTNETDIKLSASIMADPRRKECVPPLVEAIGKDIPVAWDDGSQNRIKTGKNAWLMHEPDATHHVVFQEDIVVCRDVLKGIENAIRVMPDVPILYFLMQRGEWSEIGRTALSQGCNWIRGFLEWGQAISMPVNYIRPAYDWIEKKCKLPNYDTSLMYFFTNIRMHQYFTVPSLVDHRKDVESLVCSSKSAGRRYSNIFIGEDKSGAEIKWNKRIYKTKVSFNRQLITLRSRSQNLK